MNAVHVLRPRPISIGIITFLMMWGSVVAALELLSQSSLQTSLVETIFLGVVVIVNLVAAVAILNRRNWGRLLYMGWNVLVSILGLAIVPDKLALLPGLAAFVIITFFLYRPKVNTYFRSLDAANDA